VKSNLQKALRRRRGKDASNMLDPSIVFLIVAIGVKRSPAAFASDFAGSLCQMLLSSQHTVLRPG